MQRLAARWVDMRRLLSFPELKTVKGIRYSRSHIRRLVKAKIFPQPVKQSSAPNGVNGWFDDEIDEYLEARAAERDKASVEEPSPTQRQVTAETAAPENRAAAPEGAAALLISRPRQRNGETKCQPS